MPEGTPRSWSQAAVPGRWTVETVWAADQSGRFRKEVFVLHKLVEAHVLAAIRRRHGVKLPTVRRALDCVHRQFRVEHPLIDQSFQTDGLDLFVERDGDLINASLEGQRAMKEIIGVYLKRIERDAKGLPVKLYPFTRDTQTEAAPATDPRVAVMNPAISFGRPVIDGTGIPVSSIYERYKAGDSAADLAQDFRLEIGEIEEAIRCEAA